MEEAARRLGVQLIKQYPAQEQAELKVRAQVPGSWFGGQLTAAEKSELYWAQAKGFSMARRFPKQGVRKEQTCAGIQFLCESDVVDDPAHDGFWMPLLDWNRYRHETYKDDREAELPYIRTPGDAAVEAAPAPAAPAISSKAAIYSEFNVIETGTHMQKCKDGAMKTVKCEYMKCKNSSGKCKSQQHVFKVIASGTHKIRAHLKTCNPARYLELAGMHTGPLPGTRPHQVIGAARRLAQATRRARATSSRSGRCCHIMWTSR